MNRQVNVMNEQLAEIWQRHKKLLLGAALFMGLIFFPLANYGAKPRESQLVQLEFFFHVFFNGR